MKLIEKINTHLNEAKEEYKDDKKAEENKEVKKDEKDLEENKDLKEAKTLGSSIKSTVLGNLLNVKTGGGELWLDTTSSTNDNYFVHKDGDDGAKEHAPMVRKELEKLYNKFEKDITSMMKKHGFKMM